jgi:hypothetical protein
VSNKDLVDLAMGLAQRIEDAPAESNMTPAKVAQTNLGQVQPALPAVQDGAFFPTTTSAKQRKTADELAAMIAADLREVKGCPKRGLKVTVYGLNPWNAWLSFGADAGPVPNKAELLDFLEIITERLKRLYDVPS